MNDEVLVQSLIDSAIKFARSGGGLGVSTLEEDKKALAGWKSLLLKKLKETSSKKEKKDGSRRSMPRDSRETGRRPRVLGSN